MMISTHCHWPECPWVIEVVGEPMPLLMNHFRILDAQGWLTVEDPTTQLVVHYCPTHRAIYKEHND